MVMCTIIYFKHINKANQLRQYLSVLAAFNVTRQFQSWKLPIIMMLYMKKIIFILTAIKNEEKTEYFL